MIGSGRRGGQAPRRASKLTDKEITLNIKEIKRPELDAQLVADNVARQLEQRISFRRAMKRAVQSAMRMGAQGIKIVRRAVSAARRSPAEGSEPAGAGAAAHPAGGHRLCQSTANTTFGTIGVKVWIFKGEVVDGGRRVPGTACVHVGQNGVR